MDEHAPQSDPLWTDEARRRVENAPSFVRPGIYKLVEKRARELGQASITSDFLTQIRNESMLRVSKSLRRMGFEDLRMEAWEAARSKMQRHARKVEVIEEITRFLAARTSRSEEILGKFRDYLQSVPEVGLPWTEEARGRMKRLPSFLRPMVERAVGEGARQAKEKVVTPQLLDRILAGFRRTGSAGLPGEAAGPLREEIESCLTLLWTEEARRRLGRIPLPFVRRWVAERAEGLARRRKIARVDLSFLEDSLTNLGPSDPLS